MQTAMAKRMSRVCLPPRHALPLMLNCFAKLLDINFPDFVKIKWMPSSYTKLLELLLEVLWSACLRGADQHGRSCIVRDERMALTVFVECVMLIMA
jgi:hypothetical protein